MKYKCNNKKSKGQYFTFYNPFEHELFYEWLNKIDNIDSRIILEPFCGINSIPFLLNKMNFDFNWHCFDIDKKNISKNRMPNINIEVKNCFTRFPKGYNVIITNPPYLSQHSAKRQNIDFPSIKYDNLYKLSLSLMLKNSDYIAAILPESFITQPLFKSRLYGVISINNKVFNDTEFPVCLALFLPEKSKKHWVYLGREKIGYYHDLKKLMIQPLKKYKVKFNEPDGEIALRAIDNGYEDSICFFKGNNFQNLKINKMSRHFTRISVDINTDMDLIIIEANNILKNLRETTHDLFLTSFKGLRKDGKYRRRLDYRTARYIINKAIENINTKVVKT